MAEERRIVTALFADVAGSTALGEELDPEDVRALLSRYYDVARDVITRHGGTVEKFIGDAVMAVFGLPVAHGDDAERALAAALALRDAIAADPALERIRPRIGVNTGEVIAARDASRGEFLVTGDPVNVAARIQQSAEPGQILAGEATKRAATRFVYGAMRALAAKGKSAPVRAWPVVAPGGRAAARAPFVGRAADLDQLRLTARRAFTERRPYLVTITAPAGTGKSRLVEELIADLRSASAVRVATAQCLPYGQTLTYWPLRAVLADLFGGEEVRDRASTRERVRALGGESADEIGDLVAASAWPEDVEQQDRDRIFDAWRRFVERLAADGPLVVVFEDLHWAADSLLDLVDHVMQPRTRAPLLILSIARPELLERRASWGGGRRNYVNLALEPLSDDEIADLVRHLLEADPPDAVRRAIVERAEGNPFFAGELARTLLDRGIDERARADDLASALSQLPATVHATVLARLDLLGPEDRAVAQAAAVVGRSFGADEVAALLGADRAAVDEAVDRLIEKDLVQPADGALTFRHILIREVAYQTLPRARRARDHSALARLLASRPDPDRVAELVALHYLEATRLRRGLAVAAGEAAAEDDRRQAIAWLSRAADANSRIGAIAEASQLLRDAIAIARPEEELALQEQLGTVITYGDEALLACRRAYDLWRDLGAVDPTLGARVLARYLVNVERWQGAVSPQNRPDLESIVRLNDEALELARASGDERVLAMVLVARSFFPFWSADHSAEAIARARSDAEDAVRIFERLDDATWLSAAYDGLGSIMQAADDARGQYEVSRRRARVLDRLTDLGERTDTLVTHAWSCVALGKVREGLDHARLAAASIPPGRALNFRLHALAWVCTLAAMAGEWDEVLEAARDALATWNAMGRPFANYRRHGIAAALLVARRRRETRRADELVASLERVAPPAGVSTGVVARAFTQSVVDDAPDRALVVLERLGREPTSMNMAERALSYLAMTGTAPNVLLERIDELIEWSEREGVDPIVAHLLRLRSVAVGGDVPALARAEAILDQCGMVPDRALAQLDRAALTGDRALLGTVRRDLERIGDLVGVERADALATSP